MRFLKWILARHYWALAAVLFLIAGLTGAAAGCFLLWLCQLALTN